MVGGRFPAFTISRNESLVRPPLPSATVTVTKAEPYWLAAGVRRMVRFAPEPPRVMPLLGSRTRLAEAAVTVQSDLAQHR